MMRKRKRVQHQRGEVLTCPEVEERLRLEMDERDAKKTKKLPKAKSSKKNASTPPLPTRANDDDAENIVTATESSIGNNAAGTSLVQKVAKPLKKVKGPCIRTAKSAAKSTAQTEEMPVIIRRSKKRRPSPFAVDSNQSAAGHATSDVAEPHFTFNIGVEATMQQKLKKSRLLSGFFSKVVAKNVRREEIDFREDIHLVQIFHAMDMP